MIEPPLPAPTLLEGDGKSPIILSIPHSGRDIPDWLSGRVVGGRDALLALSDPHVDAIAAPWIEHGLAALVANTPRAAIDPNRRPDELDPLICDCPPPPPGSKASHGIGLIPSRGRGRRPLWKAQVGADNVNRRLETAWHPFHRMLAELTARTVERHGQAIVLDLHSMPPPSRGLPRVILGDRHGSSAAQALVETVQATVVSCGEECGLNHPYAGGAIAAIHGVPDNDVHVIQIEFDRAMYLDPRLRKPGPGLSRARLILGAIIEALDKRGTVALAAE